MEKANFSLKDHTVKSIVSFFLFLSLCPQVIILIGNKADLEAQRDVTYEEAKQFAEENGEPDTKPQMLETARGF